MLRTEQIEDFDVVVVGAGLSGGVIARELADASYRVLILERRDHIGGNMFDFVEQHGLFGSKVWPSYLSY